MIQSNSLDVTSLASHSIPLNTYFSCPFLNDKHFCFQNAPTQSLLRVVNGILDESIERKRGEIPHVCLLLMTFSKRFLWNTSVYFLCTLLLMTNFSYFCQRVVYLLRNVIQEIEHRISIQADHIKNVKYTIPFVLKLHLFHVNWILNLIAYFPAK
jgi:kinesin family protein C2/C3